MQSVLISNTKPYALHCCIFTQWMQLKAIGHETFVDLRLIDNPDLLYTSGETVCLNVSFNSNDWGCMRL